MRKIEYGATRLSGRALLEMMVGEREKALAGIHPKAKGRKELAVEVEELRARLAKTPPEEIGS